ncbi:MAG: hypothetical protein AABX54_01100 [Nanoarchaeota archaeon]
MTNNLNLEGCIDKDLNSEIHPQNIQRFLRKEEYIGDVMFASGTGIGITGLLTESYSLVLVGVTSFLFGLGYRLCTGYTHNRINARQNLSNSPPSKSP